MKYEDCKVGDWYRSDNNTRGLFQIVKLKDGCRYYKVWELRTNRFKDYIHQSGNWGPQFHLLDPHDLEEYKAQFL